MRLSGLAVFIPTLWIALCDQLSKIFILATMVQGESLPVIRGIFHITFVGNRGAAFGILKGYNLLFIAISFVVMVWLVGYLLRQTHSSATVLACILGGALGNTLDRLRLGYVVDFLDFRVWPVFNIADTAITIGTCFLIIHIIRYRNLEGAYASDHR